MSVILHLLVESRAVDFGDNEMTMWNFLLKFVSFYASRLRLLASIGEIINT